MRLQINRQESRNLQPFAPVSGGTGRILRRAFDVGVLMQQRRNSFAHPAAHHIFVRSFCQAHDVREVPIACARLLAGMSQPLQCEFPHRSPAQSIARRTRALIDRDQRLVGKPAQQINDRFGRGTERRGKTDHGLDRPALYKKTPSHASRRCSSADSSPKAHSSSATRLRWR